MKEVLITYSLSYIIIIISALIYNLLGFNDVNIFLNNIYIYVILVYYIITIIYLYKKNKREESRIPIKKSFPLILIGLSIATIYNMIIYKFNPPLNIDKPISLIILIISSGVIGPIFEEIVFRYVYYNKLRKKYSPKKSILINSIVFSIIHINPLKMIYAFILGIILNNSYEKYKTIKAPILIHISANIIVLFLKDYKPIILIASFLLLILSIILIKKIDIN